MNSRSGSHTHIYTCLDTLKLAYSLICSSAGLILSSRTDPPSAAEALRRQLCHTRSLQRRPSQPRAMLTYKVFNTWQLLARVRQWWSWRWRSKREKGNPKLEEPLRPHVQSKHFIQDSLFFFFLFFFFSCNRSRKFLLPPAIPINHARQRSRRRSGRKSSCCEGG